MSKVSRKRGKISYANVNYTNVKCLITFFPFTLYEIYKTYCVHEIKKAYTFVSLLKLFS